MNFEEFPKKSFNLINCVLILIEDFELECPKIYFIKH
jgi:hypothetical protein